MKLGKRIRCEKGSLVVEAALALPVFMFAIVTMLFIVEICAAQMLITNTANGVAKDFAKYSYLYCKVGAYGAQSDVNQKASEANGVAVKVLNSNNISELVSAVEESIQVIKSSKTFGQSFCYMLLSNGLDVGINAIGSKVIDEIAKKRIETKDVSAQELLDHYGIQNLKWYFRFDTATDQIYIVADYKVQVIELLNIDYKFHFIKATKTLVWNPKVNYPSGGE